MSDNLSERERAAVAVEAFSALREKWRQLFRTEGTGRTEKIELAFEARGEDPRPISHRWPEVVALDSIGAIGARFSIGNRFQTPPQRTSSFAHPGG